MGELLRHKPTAYLPLAISTVALLIVLGHAALYGTAHEADEGAAAHIFQLLMLSQAALMLVFAIRWLPAARLRAAGVLGLQVLAAACAMASVYFLT